MNPKKLPLYSSPPLRGMDGPVVRDSSGHIIAEASDDDSAALIVRAVNCHHEMLEALKTIAAYPVARGYPDGPCIESEDMKEIKAIIAKAEEAQPLSTHQAV